MTTIDPDCLWGCLLGVWTGCGGSARLPRPPSGRSGPGAGLPFASPARVTTAALAVPSLCLQLDVRLPLPSLSWLTVPLGGTLPSDGKLRCWSPHACVAVAVVIAVVAVAAVVVVAVVAVAAAVVVAVVAVAAAVIVAVVAVATAVVVAAVADAAAIIIAAVVGAAAVIVAAVAGAAAVVVAAVAGAAAVIVAAVAGAAAVVVVARPRSGTRPREALVSPELNGLPAFVLVVSVSWLAGLAAALSCG